MTFRERCACGAEFEVSDGKVERMDGSYAYEAIQAWRERHEKVCPNVSQVSQLREHTIDTCREPNCPQHWYAIAGPT